MRRVWTLAVAGWMACGDPSVQVSFTIPPAYQAAVAEVSLQVLVPPVAKPFDCDDLAFQDVDADTVSSSVVQEVSVERGDTDDLENIPRLGDKLFYARGWDENGEPVVAGCTLVGDVEKTTAVEVEGAPVAFAGPENQTLGLELATMFRVDITDALDERLADVPVRWTVVGPGGQTIEGETVSTNMGQAFVLPQKPDLPGPVALDIKVKWAATPVDPVLAFGTPPMLEKALPTAVTTGPPLRLPTDAQFHVGPIGPQGQIGVAALGPTDNLGPGRPLYMAYWDPTANPDPFREVTINLNVQAALAIGAYRQGNRDRLVVIGGDKWLDIEPTGAVSERAWSGGAARRILAVGSCDGDETELLVSFSDSSLRAYTTSGAELSNSAWINLAPSMTQPIASGCVGASGALDRTVVFVNEQGSAGGNNGSPQLLADMDTMRSGAWSSIGAGIGFTPPLGDEPAYLLGAELDLDGVNLSRYKLMTEGDAKLSTASDTSDDAPTLVLSSGGGDVDGDGVLDVVQLLQFGQAENAAQYRLLFALGVEHRGERLTGITQNYFAETPRLYMADFDEDGYDDLLVASPDGFVIFEMGPAD